MNKLIELKNVSKIFKQGDTVIRAVDNVTWSIEDSGKLIAIVGPSGSGKTTLLNLLGALDIPDQGEVIIEGKNISHFSEKQLSEYRKRKIGFVFQSYNLIPNLTALENVMLPMEFLRMPREQAEKRAEELLRELKIEHRKNQKPPKLSGGEQQRVAIARALANDPDIVLADEPTGNLDSRTGREIIQLLKNLARTKNKTVIVVTHDEGIVEIVDEKYILRDGKIIAQA
ncbi:ABC transporter ATP-binding protein [Patescibacteria group bacterium AH-259-L07]|nr:ABC transporter ATP-binding protein [Patescibacteria group bacterium AH-259-L07]